MAKRFDSHPNQQSPYVYQQTMSLQSHDIKIVMEFKQKVSFKDTLSSLVNDQANHILDLHGEVQKSKGKTQIQQTYELHNAQKSLQSEFKEKCLTQQERRLVGDIGKLFTGEASKPAKLLIRLNQTQTNRAGSAAAAQNRLEKIEVTRLQEGQRADHKNPIHHIDLACLSPPMEEFDHPESDIDIWHQDESQDHRHHLQIHRQVAIMFTPDLNISSVLGMKNPPTLFTRFGKKQQRSEKRPESALSYELLDEKMSKDNDFAPEATNFVKLMEIELFLRRKEGRQQRSEELRHANEKLLAAHISSKEEMERTQEMMKKSEKLFKEQLDQLESLIEVEKHQNKQLRQQLEAKQQSLQTVNRLKQQYAIQNNNLKQKIKEYIKIIHELKVEATRALDTQRTQPEGKPAPKPTKGYTIYNTIYTSNDYDVPPPKSLKREVTFHAISHEPNQHQYYYHPTYANEMDERDCARSYQGKMREEMKLANCRSQILLTRGEVEKTAMPAPKPTSLSQKATGIKKNTPSQEPISPSTRNLVRVNKNTANDASVMMGQKLRGNKSLSSISNLSGKSLSQRVGFVSKPPPAQRKQGMLVDYMVQPYSNLEAGQSQQESSRREKFSIRKE